MVEDMAGSELAATALISDNRDGNVLFRGPDFPAPDRGFRHTHPIDPPPWRQPK